MDPKYRFEEDPPQFVHEIIQYLENKAMEAAARKMCRADLSGSGDAGLAGWDASIWLDQEKIWEVGSALYEEIPDEISPAAVKRGDHELLNKLMANAAKAMQDAVDVETSCFHARRLEGGKHKALVRVTDTGIELEGVFPHWMDTHGDPTST
jgi:DNA-binding protein YbaB